MFFKRQQLRYCIFVAEQYDDGVFNKARIMNAAFVYITKLYDFDCFIFHDVDMLLENDLNVYRCGKFPKHLSPGKLCFVGYVDSLLFSAKFMN